MAKPGELDWGDLMKGKVGSEHPYSKPLKKWTKGEKPTEEELQKEKATLSTPLPHGFRQATDQELFGHLVVSEEELKKREESWKNGIVDFYKNAKQPIKQEDDPRFKDAWTSGKSFLDSMTDEEREAWKKASFKEGIKE